MVGAGNLSYVFTNSLTLGTGITSLPAVRSTEGQFPYWLGVDDRLTSDEFFRGSYTTGVWIKGALSPKVNYMAMLGNNLSQLGVSAAQLDNHLQTLSFMVNWLPTTGEFGYIGTFGDFDYHEQRGHPTGRPLHAEPRGQAGTAGHEQHREFADPVDGRQHHLHAGSVRAGYHRRERALLHG